MSLFDAANGTLAEAFGSLQHTFTWNHNASWSDAKLFVRVLHLPIPVLPMYPERLSSSVPSQVLYGNRHGAYNVYTLWSISAAHESTALWDASAYNIIVNLLNAESAKTIVES